MKKFEVFEPSLALRDYIECIYRFQFRSQDEFSFEDRVVPNGRYEIIWDVLGVVQIDTDGQGYKDRPELAVYGLLDKHCFIRAKESTTIFGAIIKPGMLDSLDINIDSYKFINPIYEESLCQRDQKPDIDKYCWDDSLTCFETFLLKTIKPGVNYNPLIIQAIHLIDAEFGNLSISSIHSLVGCSKRHLNRTFKTIVGISPKKYAQIVKMNKILEQLSLCQYSLLEITYLNNYFDQSHFNRAFKEIVGISPKRYIQDESFFMKKLIQNKRGVEIICGS